MTNSSLELRKHKRYKALDKVIALAFEDVCRLTDISIGGAAIKCLGKSNLPSQWSLDILMMEDNFHATIPVKLAWEKDVQLPSLFIKHVGVQFEEMTAEIRSKVEYLIQTHEQRDELYAV